MESSKSFKDLIVWQKAHQFVIQVYQLSKKMPKDEQYGITNQMKRSSVSIAANIVEGYKRIGKKDKLKFYNIAQASLEETRYFLILIEDLGLVKNLSIEHKMIDSTSKLLLAYCRKLKQNM
jgi:four helix bundle protein